MYRVSVELYKHEWKFGRTRNAVGTRAVGECFHSFFDFSQTFTSVCTTLQKHGMHVFYLFQKTTRREKEKQLVNFDYQNVSSLCSRRHTVKSARQFCVSIKLYSKISFIVIVIVVNVIAVRSYAAKQNIKTILIKVEPQHQGCILFSRCSDCVFDEKATVCSLQPEAHGKTTTL